MKNMKENLFNKLGEKLAINLGEASIKLSEKAMGKCFIGAIYEPKVPIEMLKETIDK